MKSRDGTWEEVEWIGSRTWASLDRALGGGADQGADHHALQAAHQVNLESEVGVLQGVVAGGVRPVLGEGGGGEEEGG